MFLPISSISELGLSTGMSIIEIGGPKSSSSVPLLPTNVILYSLLPSPIPASRSLFTVSTSRVNW